MFDTYSVPDIHLFCSILVSSYLIPEAPAIKYSVSGNQFTSSLSSLPGSYPEVPCRGTCSLTNQSDGCNHVAFR